MSYICSILGDGSLQYQKKFDPQFVKALPEKTFREILNHFKTEHGACVMLEKLQENQVNTAFFRTDKDRLVKIIFSLNEREDIITGLWLKGEVSSRVDLEKFSDYLCKQIKRNPRLNYEIMFHSSFRNAIQEVQVRQILSGLYQEFGTCQSYTLETSDGVDGDIKTIHSSDKKLSFIMNLAREDGMLKIAGLRYTGPVTKAITFKNRSELYSHIKKISGEFSLYFEDLNGQGLIAHNENKEQALGSVFKLYVLATLLDQIKHGKTSWEKTIKIEEKSKSLPSGNMQNLANGTKVTLKKLAENMISISDNTATDHLIHFLGAQAIEDFIQKEKLISNKQKNIPFLTTLEMFKTRAYFSEQDVARYNFASRDSRVKMLNQLPYKSRADLLKRLSNWQEPRYLKDIEWFATAREVCDAISWISMNTDLQIPHILSRNTPFLELKKSSNLSYVGYKGGSEPGVLAMTYWLKDKKGNEYCLYVGVNDEEKAIDESFFFTSVQGILDYIQSNELKN